MKRIKLLVIVPNIYTYSKRKTNLSIEIHVKTENEALKGLHYKAKMKLLFLVTAN